MIALGEAYEFAFRGLLCEEALDRSGRRPRTLADQANVGLALAVSLDVLDEAAVEEAKAMSVVFTAIAAFENSVRRLITTILRDEVGEAWWDTCASDRIRKRAEARREEEAAAKWHAQRGVHPLYFTDLGDLAAIIQQNWDRFDPHIRSAEWAKGLLSSVERSRNVIMHGGTLAI